jgi:hypothetical protein
MSEESRPEGRHEDSGRGIRIAYLVLAGERCRPELTRRSDARGEPRCLLGVAKAIPYP